MVRVKRLKLAGHILHLPEVRPASEALNCEPVSGKRRQGKPHKTWRSTFREALQAVSLSHVADGRNCSPDVPEGTGGTISLNSLSHLQLHRLKLKITLFLRISAKKNPSISINIVITSSYTMNTKCNIVSVVVLKLKTDNHEK